MGLTSVARLVPASLRIDPVEAERIAEGCRWNKRAMGVLKPLDFNVKRIRIWIADNQPEQKLLEAMRRVHSEHDKRA